jgi:hypothetical protein
MTIENKVKRRWAEGEPVFHGWLSWKWAELGGHAAALCWAPAIRPSRTAALAHAGIT